MSTKSGWLPLQNFWFLVLIAVLFSQIPIVNIPFQWLETFFHEISHGLAAILSGGHIIRIQLFANGAGLCTSAGGNSVFVAFSGYAGAVLFGMLLYWGAGVHRQGAKIISGILIAMIIVTLLLWVKDLLTAVICLVLTAIFSLKLAYSRSTWLAPILKIISLVVLLNALQSPWYLWSTPQKSDAYLLAQYTMIPGFIWIIIWLAMAIWGLLLLSKRNQGAKG
ncbi:M50 family metallopeptidase [Thalassotalea sp. PS06]|uniref:M50 family metallopeptidase n=1 Tax=Thalassotalea sp. PS06 TaxID=2594005 RepID=UPI001164349E|nr:M50 family metallopeptidase [Thalassotalea sp. PS06]QDP00958.1 M50 family metallopeptidase [Thalassotalea sp. PS06]